MDSQDLILDAEVDDERVWDEAQRLEKLCKWGRKHNFDGFARLQSSIEVMLCDFAAGLEVVSFLNLASEFSVPPTSNATGGPNVQPALHLDSDDPDQPTLQKVYRTIEVGLWHSGPFGTSTPSGPPESRSG
ncbi:hypothetical protein EST38_g5851 [Candolleomyces aberdarensis]|uniref:Uncharacterized protein n=1 Tax=Candolleomyces aberdarensis TaxID=2316362 RepID=A0A4Q2DLF4_9AGAR|nr:hypothetical protein EST38_g5851 [Candolleomyces aberdarensis]